MFLTKKIKTLVVAIVGAIAFLTMGAGCDTSAPTAQDKQQDQKIASIQTLIEKQPAHFMDYSPTRNTINAWAKKWETPGKLAYTYITEGPNDDKGGYYVFVGPPVSYCVGLTDPQQQKKVDQGDYMGTALGQAPGIDGVYGGGDCSVFYGIDAVSGNIVTFSVGLGQNLFYADQPNARYKGAEPLGTATVATAKAKN